MQRAEEVELAPLEIGQGRVNVKVLLPLDAYRNISEIVRRLDKKCGLWRVTLYEIFMVGY